MGLKKKVDYRFQPASSDVSDFFTLSKTYRLTIQLIEKYVTIANISLKCGKSVKFGVEILYSR